MGDFGLFRLLKWRGMCGIIGVDSRDMRVIPLVDGGNLTDGMIEYGHKNAMEEW